MQKQKPNSAARLRVIGGVVALAAGMACVPALAQNPDEGLIANPLETPEAAVEAVPPVNPPVVQVEPGQPMPVPPQPAPPQQQPQPQQQPYQPPQPQPQQQQPAPTALPADGQQPLPEEAQPLPMADVVNPNLIDTQMPPANIPAAQRIPNEPRVTQESLAEEIAQTPEGEKPPPAPKSLFFNEEEMSVIQQALDNYVLKMRATRADDDYLSRLAGSSSDKDRPAEAPPPQQESRIYMYPQFYLKSIMYQSPESWTIWVNDYKIGTESWTSRNELRVIDINKERVVFEWTPPSIDRVMQFWDSIGDPENVKVNVERGVVTFSLRQNQTFSSYRMMAMEGKLQPVQSDSNDVGALLSLQQKKEEISKGQMPGQPRPPGQPPQGAQPGMRPQQPYPAGRPPGAIGNPNQLPGMNRPGVNRPGMPNQPGMNRPGNPNQPGMNPNQRRAPQQPQYRAPTLPPSSQR